MIGNTISANELSAATIRFGCFSSYITIPEKVTE
jgi:hypothetical protein